MYCYKTTVVLYCTVLHLYDKVELALSPSIYFLSVSSVPKGSMLYFVVVFNYRVRTDIDPTIQYPFTHVPSFVASEVFTKLQEAL